MNTIRLGDKCSVSAKLSPLIKHFGICVGFAADSRPLFVHNTFNGGVMHASEEEFAGDRPIHVEQHAPPGYGTLVAQRALALVGRKYDLLGFNCEHLANLAANGRSESRQVERAVTAGLGFALLAYLNRNGTSVDSHGYRRNSRGQFASRRWW